MPEPVKHPTSSLLAAEVSALVHQVELNRAGWWDRTVQRLVLAAVWLCEGSPTTDEVNTTLKTTFSLDLSRNKFDSAVGVLESQNLVVRLPASRLRIPDENRLEFEKEIAAAEAGTDAARKFFFSLVEKTGQKLDPVKAWDAFDAEFLTPLIRDVGANAYRLIAGERLTADTKLVERFLSKFDRAAWPALRELVAAFLDPKRAEVRGHVSRMLHATFCVEASGLSEDAVQKLTTAMGKQVHFRIFVDTNFLFSLLELHENPSNAAAAELQEILRRLTTNPKVQLFVTPRTIEEAKTSLSAAKFRAMGLPPGQGFTQAALHAGVSGMTERFLIERSRLGGSLSANDWFDPYLDDFVPLARAKGVELFNVKLDSYATRADVVDDINLVIRFEKPLPANRRKGYEKVAHDMILWHFVADKRPALVESPVDAQDWILTVDFRFIAFDEHKQERAGLTVPMCLHPTSLIQLLQFWVPRTKEFEEAILGSLRLPFLFQELDPEEEKTTLQILKGLGRFEGADQISEQAITEVVLNEGLRARLRAQPSAEEEIEIIRDALVEEMKLRADAQAREAAELRRAVEQREAQLDSVGHAARTSAEEVKTLQAQLAAENARAAAAAAILREQQAQIEHFEKSRDKIEQSRKKRRALILYVGILALVVALALAAGSWTEHLPRYYLKFLGVSGTKALASLLTFLMCHLLVEITVRKKHRISSLWPFKQVRRFRKFLWTLVILGFCVGVLGNLYANFIQKNIDAESTRPSATPSPRSSPGEGH